MLAFLPRRLLLLGSLAIALGCSESSTAPSIPSVPAGITGRITAITGNGPYAGTIRVEANPDSSSAGDKAIVSVSSSATILSVDRKDVDFRVLVPGQWVRVWFSGPVLESYPVQGSASTVVIDSAAVSVAK